MIISPANDCALSGFRCTVEEFYSVRYLLGLHFRVWGDEVRLLEIGNDNDINNEWYKLGLYEKRGYDYFHRTYRLVENDEHDDVEAACDSERMAGSEERRLYNTWG
jgi:hypothetical protein